MKKLIFIALAVTLALGIIWVPSVAAVGPYPIEITKTIPVGGPTETFTFEAWRDMNNNGIIDFVDPWPDILVGTVDITGAGTGVINSPFMGNTIIREVLAASSAYEQQPNQIVHPPCDEVIFNNDVEVQEVGQIVILKKDGAGNALVGATFEITPDPKTGTGSLAVVDNGLNDELPLTDGVLLVTGCLVCIPVTVTETVPPPGYAVAPPQPAHVTTAGETVELTFIDVRERGQIRILKEDPAGNALFGATFVITPDPKTGTGSLTVVDNGLNDEDPADGVLLVTGCLVCVPVTVTETVPPPGYTVAPPQPAHVTTAGETVELTFIDTPELSCGTVCAAQTAPGEYLFGGGQSNWFTWIYYNKGWGTEASPKTYPIYTGQTTLCGTLYVYDDGTHIFVNYVLTDTATCTLGGLSQYHLQVDKSLTDLKKHVMNKKNPVPGKCEYKGTFDPMVPATGPIEATNDNITSWTTAYIFAHGIGCYYCP